MMLGGLSSDLFISFTPLFPLLRTGTSVPHRYSVEVVHRHKLLLLSGAAFYFVCSSVIAFTFCPFSFSLLSSIECDLLETGCAVGER